MLHGAGNLLDRPPLTHNADSNPEWDSNPCFSLERASPWVAISPTSQTGATAWCHSRPRSAPRIRLLISMISNRARAMPPVGTEPEASPLFGGLRVFVAFERPPQQ